jgi:hypothetical protein
MTKLEKNILVAMEDAAEEDGAKVVIDGAKEDNKSFFVQYTSRSLSLYWGKEKVVTLDRSVYMALATKLFVEYIKF